MNPADQNTPFGRLAKGPANGSQPAHSGGDARLVTAQVITQRELEQGFHARARRALLADAPS